MGLCYRQEMSTIGQKCAKSKQPGLSCIHTELDTAETFADMALDDFETTPTIREHARRGYETAGHYLRAVTISLEEREDILRRRNSLRLKLEELGEEF